MEVDDTEMLYCLTSAIHLRELVTFIFYSIRWDSIIIENSVEQKKKMKLGLNNPACLSTYAAIILCFAGQTALANPVSAEMPAEAAQTQTQQETQADSPEPSRTEAPPAPTKTETSGEQTPESSGVNAEDPAQDTDISAL